jgi:hypothetical protein
MACSTYYTKLYLIEEPSDNLFDHEKIIDNFEGWSFSLKVMCSYKSPNKQRVQKDSFHVSIGAIASNTSLVGTDSVFIESPSVELSETGSIYDIVPYSVYSTNEGIGFIYYPIHIPPSEKYILVKFTIVIIKPDGQRTEKDWQSELYRYETKQKGLPAGLFDPPN